MKQKTLMLKLNVALRGHRAGEIIRLRTDNNGIMLDTYWRRRLKDAEIDGCVEIMNTPKKQTKKSDEGDK